MIYMYNIYIMPLRSGREYLKVIFPKETMPINLILLEKVERKKYKVNIDFDLASKEWRKNKILLGNGMFKYKK